MNTHADCNSDAEPPEHGKREIPTAVFTLKADGNAQMAYAVMPYPKGASPALEIASQRTDNVTQVKVRLPNGILDEITLGGTSRVPRTLPGGKPATWAVLEIAR